mgnify:CR=1 FL=1
MDIKIFASGSSGNCYQINDGKTSLLLECGIPKQRILSAIGYDIGKISGVLISHEHGDHAKAAKDMMASTRNRANDIAAIITDARQPSE